MEILRHIVPGGIETMAQQVCVVMDGCLPSFDEEHSVHILYDSGESSWV